MEDLGEDCLSKILCFTTPRDVCRLSCVNNMFMSSSYSDLVWNSFISHPIIDNQIISKTSSKRQLYFHLCDDPVLIHNGYKRMMVWVERTSGNFYVRILAKDLDINHVNNSRFWQWNSHHNHPFCKEAAEVVAVHELEVLGTLDCKILNPGVEYKICFEIKLIRCPSNEDEDEDDGDLLERCLGVGKREAFGWDEHPVMLSVEYPLGNVQEKYIYLTELEELCCCNCSYGWMEVEAGRLTIENTRAMYKNGNCKNEEDVEIKVKMRQVDDSWKGGLVLGGIIVLPTNPKSIYL